MVECRQRALENINVNQKGVGAQKKQSNEGEVLKRRNRRRRRKSKDSRLTQPKA